MDGLGEGKSAFDILGAEINAELGEAANLATEAEVEAAQLAQEAREFTSIVPCGGNSFVGSTPVLMADGTSTPIQNVKVGDRIANAEPESEALRQHTVTGVHVTDDDTDFVDLAISSPGGLRTVTATAHHLFWNITTHAWTAAADIKPGEQLDTPHDGRATVASNRRYIAHLRTHNLTVGSLHTYYVGAGGTWLLVHNAGPCGLFDALRQWSSQRFQFGNQQFLLDKSNLTHILVRHHPEYWDGSIKATQSFFDKNMSIQDVQDAISSVLKQNRDMLIRRGGRGIYQIEGSYNGVDYVLGLNYGHIGQFYPGTLP
jgi:hypothetical protein